MTTRRPPNQPTPPVPPSPAPRLPGSPATFLPGKPHRRPCSPRSNLICAAPRWRIRLERAEQPACRRCDLLHRRQECSFVGFRGLVETADLAHKLDCRSPDICLAHRWFVVKQGLDISTHKLFLNDRLASRSYCQALVSRPGCQPPARQTNPRPHRFIARLP